MTARDRIVVAVVAVVALLAGSWLLVIQPKRAQAAKLGTQVQAAQSQLSKARAQVAQGEANRSQFASNYAEVAQLGEAVPADDNVPSLIYQLQDAASATGVSFHSLQVTNGAPTSSAPGSQGSSNLPPGVSSGSGGFPTEQFSFTFRGNFFRLADFLGRLQRFVVATNNHISVSGRLLSLNAINLAPAPKGFPQITATVAATTYLLPASQGLTAGATPVGPAGTAPSGPAGASPTPSAPSSSGTAPASAATVTPPTP